MTTERVVLCEDLKSATVLIGEEKVKSIASSVNFYLVVVLTPEFVPVPLKRNIEDFPAVSDSVMIIVCIV